MRHSLFRLICSAAVSLFVIPSSLASPASELAEWMLKKSAKFSDDIAGRSSNELTLELEELASKSSDSAVRELIEHGGPGALKAVSELGDRAPEAVVLIAKHGTAGKLVVEQGKTLALDVFQEFGDDGVKLLVREGASQGGRMLKVYGKSLAETAQRLSPESMARLRHWTPQIENATAEWRNAFGQQLKTGADDFVTWVHQRWKELAVTGGLTIAVITAYRAGDGAVEFVNNVGDAILDAVPNPSANPTGWVAFWLPGLILIISIVAIVSLAWVTRDTLSTWMRTRISRR